MVGVYRDKARKAKARMQELQSMIDDDNAKMEAHKRLVADLTLMSVSTTSTPFYTRSRPHTKMSILA